MKRFHLALALSLGLALAQTHDPLDPAQFSALPEGYSVRLLAGAEEVREAALLQGGRAFPMARQLAFSGKEVWRGLLPELGPYEIRLKTKAGEKHLGPYRPPAHPFRALAWVGVRGGYQVFPDRFQNGDPGNDALALLDDEYNFNQVWQERGAPGPTSPAGRTPRAPCTAATSTTGGTWRGLRSGFPT
jgi:cyclomaltodextrinase